CDPLARPELARVNVPDQAHDADPATPDPLARPEPDPLARPLTEGRLEVPIPADVTTATLVLPDRGERYEFMVGHLEPADHWRGAAQRLRSLGLYHAEPSTPDEGLERALRRFQALRRLEVTGALDESTIAALQEAHGC
ncbi:peptidoglycan-binding domain-containing protein, partial [Nannocystis pusilla]|uniref:peptidoglycan-binding domain-containing protein n=1 Tax=Nannocystis pusilla TaxID=889268 RepID=UPI003BF0EC22